MKTIPISQSDLARLSSLYDDGYSGVELSKMFGRSTCWIYKHLKSLPNFRIRNSSEAARKYIIYEDFFDKIDTEEKAYFLGFLYADGNITNEGSIVLSQAEQDCEIVYKFAKLIGKDLCVKTHQDKRANRQLSYVVSIRSAHMVDMLIRYGCPPRKTFVLKFPLFIDKDLIRHFIRGYFDGDGCISINKHNRRGRGQNNKNTIVSTKPHYDFNIVSTYEFISELKKVFDKELNIYCRITKRYKNRDNNNFTLIVNGRRKIQKVLAWLYDDASIYLSRKHNKYLWLSGPNFNKFQVSIEEMNG